MPTLRIFYLFHCGKNVLIVQMYIAHCCCDAGVSGKFLDDSLIQKWLKAGVSEEGKWSKTEVGTPQGAVASPLLANIYLHYAFDLWVRHWRKHHATGDVIVVQYADDIVAGFQNRADAERFLQEWKDRLQKFGLELHPDKTRLIEFGHYAAANRKQRGEVACVNWALAGSRRTHRRRKAASNAVF